MDPEQMLLEPLLKKRTKKTNEAGKLARTASVRRRSPHRFPINPVAWDRGAWPLLRGPGHGLPSTLAVLSATSLGKEGWQRRRQSGKSLAFLLHLRKTAVVFLSSWDLWSSSPVFPIPVAAFAPSFPHCSCFMLLYYHLSPSQTIPIHWPSHFALFLIY